MEKRNVFSMHTRPDTFHLVKAKRKTVYHQIDQHWHDSCELELVLSGHGTHIINGHRYDLGPGDIYFFTQADCHMITAEEPIEILGIMLDEEHLSDEIFAHILNLEIAGLDIRATLSDEYYPIVEQYFTTIIREDEKYLDSSLTEGYIRRLIDCILIELLRAMGDTALPSVKDITNEAILYLHRHYAEPITLQSLSEYLHLNPSYLSSYFKHNIGCNFKNYLTELRLRHACRLLSNTELSISEVCYSCGFSSYSNFMRTFHTRYQTSPLQFRRENRVDAKENTVSIRKDEKNE